MKPEFRQAVLSSRVSPISAFLNIDSSGKQISLYRFSYFHSFNTTQKSPKFNIIQEEIKELYHSVNNGSCKVGRINPPNV
jgi:hypothetical protein